MELYIDLYLYMTSLLETLTALSFPFPPFPLFCFLNFFFMSFYPAMEMVEQTKY